MSQPRTDSTANPLHSSSTPFSVSAPASSVGVSLIRFFPYQAQFLAAGHVDGSVKLYSTDRASQTNSNLTSNGLVRTYNGHSSGLTGFHWVDEGNRFLTMSLDGWVKLWDTETGKVVYRRNTTVGAFKTNATPMCAIAEAQQATIGTGDGHVKTYDFRTNTESIAYHQMQTAITTMVQVPSFQTKPSFMVASSDGQIRVYQNGIPSVFQHVTGQEPKMITRACVHPENGFIIANTHVNSAAIFRIDETGRIKMNHKKTFTGHHTVGHSIGLTCSPDGKFLLSGDGNGKLLCWNFKTGAIVGDTKVFSATTNDVDWAWNSSMFAAASWDGRIKIWK